MKLHELKPPEGANRPRRRVARGIAGKGGKTAGRGTKGQGARDTIKPGFEGGQLPLTQRIPKLKGFRNPFRVSYAPVNLHTLESFAGDTATPATLAAVGLVRKGAMVKVLGRGELNRPLRVEAHAFSASARDAIERAGGSVEVIPPPFGHGRPPARGNALSTH
ncbi:MAG: 50S ribosomal protein L15 [Acidimicrobiales bacterium]